MGKVDNFSPSTNGLHYGNSWPPVPGYRIPIWPDVADNIVKQLKLPREVDFLEADHGLCGGMVFSVLDLLKAQTLPPSGDRNPDPDSPAFQYIVRRLTDSFGGARGAACYTTLMNPQMEGAVKVLNLWADVIPGAGEPFVPNMEHTMHYIRQEIDHNRPCPIGLICVQSSNLEDVGKNHQVLVYGYHDESAKTILNLYDPNHPNADDITLSVDSTDPAHPADFNYYDNEHDIYGFFVTEYTPCTDTTPIFVDSHHVGN